MKWLIPAAVVLVALMDCIIVFLLHSEPVIQAVLIFGLVAGCVYAATDDGEETD